MLQGWMVTRIPVGQHAGEYDKKNSVVVSMEGKIIHYKFTPDTQDPTRRNGELTVITAISSKKYTPSGKVSPNPKTVCHKWQIKVNNNAFKVVPHSSADPTDPFPGAMTFSQTLGRGDGY
jgi:hypothetical protein